MTDIKIHIANTSANPLPAYATEGAAGMDFRVALTEPLVLAPGARVLVPTGLRMAIPEGYELQMRPRSGLALRHGITLLNSPGTIDSDYRGEIGVILINHSSEPFTVNPGEHICQGVVCPVAHAVWCAVDTLDDTARGDGGFGHTGR